MSIQFPFYSPAYITPRVYQLIRLFLVTLALIGTLWVTRPLLAAPVVQEQEVQTLLVRFSPETTAEMRDTLVAEMGGVLVTWMPQISVAEIRIPMQAGIAATSMPATAMSMVDFAEHDLVVEAQAVYNDPDLADESMRYGLSDTNAIDAWNIVTGSQEIIIAVVDTGIKLDHPEFAGRLVAGYDFVNDDAVADDDMGHGTHVAGVIAAALGNGQGVAGVCPNCRLMPVKVLNQHNIGSWSHLAQGVLFAVDNGARVINLSLGAAIPSETMAAAVQYALDNGVVVVAAAGNQATDAPFYPAAMEGVIAVGATMPGGDLWARSNFGDYIDLVAPGSLVYSTYYDLNNIYHGYTFMSGTSMATPFVSGVVALLLSANGDLSPEQVLASMVEGAQDFGVPGWDSRFGYGRVNAVGALKSSAAGLTEKLGSLDSPSQVVRMYLPALNNE